MVMSVNFQEQNIENQNSFELERNSCLQHNSVNVQTVNFRKGLFVLTRHRLEASSILISDIRISDTLLSVDSNSGEFRATASLELDQYTDEAYRGYSWSS